jgi:hypothetical protein
MAPVSSSTVNQASNADLGSVQGVASIAVLKKSLDAQASVAATLIASLPQPALANSGNLGTQVNTFA